MVGVFAFPALLPTFAAEWRLSNAEAGWIAGIYFAAYAGTVPGPGRRHRPRSTPASSTSSAPAWPRWRRPGFAGLAAGFWSALALRALAGVALAATYMPGLRVLVDRYHGPRRSRAVAFYTSSFSFGTAASFFIAGWLAPRLRLAVGVRRSPPCCAVVAAILVATLPRARPEPAEADRRLLDFRPVLRNRRAMGYVLGYATHCFELFAMRSWLVAFLAFSLAAAAAPGASPPVLAGAGQRRHPERAAGGGGQHRRQRTVRPLRPGAHHHLGDAGHRGGGRRHRLFRRPPLRRRRRHRARLQRPRAARLRRAHRRRAGRRGRRPPGRDHGGALPWSASAPPPSARWSWARSSMRREAAREPSSWGAAFASLAAVGLLGPLALRLSANR